MNSSISIRVAHLDLKGVPPTARRLLEIPGVFAAAGYNALLVEWEDSFPWMVDERFRSETAYTPQQVMEFLAEAARLKLKVIPLVQCLGHMENPLRLDEYEALREVPYRSDTLNPLATGARELVQRMIEDVLALGPQPEYFHLGGDEAFAFGRNPATKEYIAQHGKGALYLHHIEPLLDMLNARGIRPLLWHDMMVEWESSGLERLATKANLCVWGYDGHPDTTKANFNSGNINRFQQHGFNLWGATAWKRGGGAVSPDLPDTSERAANALAWAEVAARYEMKGVLATGWSRGSTTRPQMMPTDSSLDSLFLVGYILEHGKAPDDDTEVLRMLERCGERERFELCRNAMQKLSDARGHCWHHIARLREQLTMVQDDPRRAAAGIQADWINYIRITLGEAEDAGDEMRHAFGGLIEPIWIERYLNERIVPLREELALLEPLVQEIDAEAYAALDSDG